MVSGMHHAQDSSRPKSRRRIGTCLALAVSLLTALSASPATLDPQGFESGLGVWTIEGGLWEIGVPTAAGGPAPFAGGQVAGTALAGNYGSTQDARLLTPVFSVPPADQTPRLTFVSWYEIGANDRGVLEVRLAGGAWQEVAGQRLTESNGGAWARHSVDLRAWAGQSVQFAFRLVASFNNVRGDSALGWYLDEVRLETGAMTLVTPAGFESGFGDWSVEGGVWQVGTPSGSGAPAPFSGTNVAGTILRGIYGYTQDARLITPEFVVPTAAESPRFTYQSWHSLGLLDSGRLEIRTVGEAGGDPWNAVPGEVLTENGGEWTRRSVDLRSYAGKKVQLGFHLLAAFQNRAGDLDLGWYMDDARLETGPMRFAAVEGFEGGFGDWSGEGGVWQVGAPSATGAPRPFEGTQVAATHLGGNYGTTHDARLVSPEFMVPARGQVSRFAFDYWYSLGLFDFVQLEARMPGGAWQPIAGERLVGIGEAWARRHVDLRPFAGQTLQMAFHFVSAFENRRGDIGLGCYLDNVRIETGPSTVASPEGFEGGFGDWSAEGGVWQIGTPTAVTGPTAFAGTGVAGTILSGNYPDGADARLVSPEFLVPPAMLAPQWSWREWRDLGRGDTARVELSLGGGDWIPLGSAATGAGRSWVTRTLDLTPYAGQLVRVGFRLTSDGSFPALGWYLDEAAVGTLDPVPLTLGALTSGNLGFEGARTLYTLEVPPGGHLRLVLDDTDNVGVNAIYVRRGAIPTTGISDYRFTGAVADQTALVPDTAPGTWFVMILGAKVPAGGSAYQLRAEFTHGIALSSLSPRRSGNRGTALVRVEGAGFDATARVELRTPDAVAAIGRTSLTSPQQLSVELDLAEVTPGSFVLTVVQGNDTASLPFEVLAGGNPRFQAHLTVPARLGRHAPGTLFVDYTNLGEVAMPAPLLLLRSTDRSLLTLDPDLGARGLYAATYPAGFASSAQILAHGDSGGLLQPGESRRIPIYHAGLVQPWDFADLSIGFSLRVLNPPGNARLDWEVAKPRIGPGTFSAPEWDSLFASFRAGVGSTWSDFTAVLHRNAEHLRGLGITSPNLGDLLALEFVAADGLGPVTHLSTSTDVAIEQPGPPLLFHRIYPQPISRRSRLGPLGYGWSHNWSYALVTAPGGDVTVELPGGGRLEFQPDLRGGYFREAGERHTLRRVSGGGHTLTTFDGSVITFSADGVWQSFSDLNGNRITATHNGGRLTVLTHSSGASLSLNYNGDRLASVIGSTGRSVVFDYDTAGHLTGATRMDEGEGESDRDVTEYTYVGSHQLESVKRAGVTEERMIYDARGRLIALRGGCCEEETTFAYPQPGYVIQTDPRGATRRFWYDQHGGLVKAIDPLGREVSLSRDAQHQVTALLGPGGAAHWFAYNKAGSVTRVTDARGASLRLGTGANGRVTSLADGRRQTTAFTYDAAGNHIGVLQQDRTTETLSHDPLGQVVGSRNRRGQTNAVSRDLFGRVTRKTTAEGRVIDFLYDARGNLVRVDDSAEGSTVFAYDALDQLASLTYPGGRGFTFTYDAAGRRTSSLTHDGYRLRYEYDDRGRLRRILEGQDRAVVTYSYDGGGRLAREDLGNGTATTYTHDVAGQVVSVVHLARDGAVRSRFDYTYDDQGRRRTVVDEEGQTVLDYDAIGQLVAVTRPDGSVTRYAYDTDGNRVELLANGVRTVGSANAIDALTVVGDAKYTFDADGNLLTRTNASELTTYRWDSEGQLVGIESPTDGRWEFAYDAFGQRVRTTHDGVTTTALFDPLDAVNLVAEYDGSGGLRARYDHGLGLTRRVDASGVAAHYHFDAAGHTRQLTDTGGAVINRYRYDPFGEAVQREETVPNPFGYVGRFGVQATGRDLLWMRARHYSPGLGRFLSADPVRFADVLANAYRYAGNDPVNFIDPSGLARICVHPLGNRTQLGWDPWPNSVKPAMEMLGSAFAVSDWLDYLNVQGLHQQFVFDKPWKGVKNIGYFSFDGMIGNKGGLSSEPMSAFTHCYSRHFDDARLAKAIAKVNDWKVYSILFRNCQNWIEEVVEEYEELESAEADSARPIDPNDLVPPAGTGARNFLRGDRPFAYRLNFENDRTATAPAQVVELRVPVPAELDLATLEFTSVGFGDVAIPIPPGSRRFEHTESVVFQDVAFETLVELFVNDGTREIHARFSSVVPETGLPPGVETGFLPPEDGTGRGQGHVGYVIQSLPGLADGTEIRSVGFVTFDRLAGGPTFRTDLVDPHDPASAPSADRQALVTIGEEATSGAATLTVAAVGSTIVRLELAGPTGERWRIERAPSVNGPWTEVTSVALNAAGTVPVEDAAPLASTAFYRAVR